MFTRARIARLLFAALALGAFTSAMAAGSLTVVANADTPPIDKDTLQRIYLGKVIEVGGHPVTPVNLARGSSLRNVFMQRYLAEDDDKFVAYWTVRRYIGQGTPPREFATIEQQLRYLRETPGAIGYVDDSTQISQGIRPLFAKP